MSVEVYIGIVYIMPNIGYCMRPEGIITDTLEPNGFCLEPICQPDHLAVQGTGNLPLFCCPHFDTGVLSKHMNVT